MTKNPMGELLVEIIMLMKYKNIEPTNVTYAEDGVAFRSELTGDQYILKLIKCEE